MKLKVLVLIIALTATLTARTIVEVNGKKIDERELYSVIQSITGGQFASFPNEKKQKALQIAREKLISDALLQEVAQASNIKKTKAYKEAFVQYVKNVLEPKLVYQVWIESEMNKMKANDKEVAQFYKENKARFNEPKQAYVRHILVSTEKEAKALIALIGKAKDKKAAFLKVASEKMGPQSPSGVSDLGMLHARSNMAPAFTKAYLSMGANTMSRKPVKTQFGYHILYVDDVAGGISRTLKEVKKFIVQTIKGQKIEKILAKRVEKLRKKAKINFK